MKRIITMLSAIALCRLAGAATLQATSSNYQQVVGSSSSGDTINFAPGTYTLTPVSGGNAAFTFPAGRTYVGNGATFALSTGIDSTCQYYLISVNGATSPATTDVSGFVFTDAQILCQPGVVNIHGNTFTNGSRGIFLNFPNSSHFDNNVFTNLSAEGIYGTGIGNGDTFDKNTFTKVWEPMHLVSNQDSTDISGNVITQPTRIGIELQNAMTNLTVNNNYIGQWLPYTPQNPGVHMGISCATEGGNKITLTGNTILHNSADGENFTGQGAAIEIGGSNVTIKNNTDWGWAGFLLAALNGPSNISNNTNYGGAGFTDWGYDGGGPYAVPNSSDAATQPLSALSPLPGAQTRPAVIPTPTAGSAVPQTQPTNAPSTLEFESVDGGRTITRTN